MFYQRQHPFSAPSTSHNRELNLSVVYLEQKKKETLSHAGGVPFRAGREILSQKFSWTCKTRGSFCLHENFCAKVWQGSEHGKNNIVRWILENVFGAVPAASGASHTVDPNLFLSRRIQFNCYCITKCVMQQPTVTTLSTCFASKKKQFLLFAKQQHPRNAISLREGAKGLVRLLLRIVILASFWR